MEEMGQQLRQMFSNLGGGKTHKRSLSIKAARPLLVEEEAGKLVNEDEVREAAIEACEQHSIVFIDEIDKVAKRSEGMGADVSREGVQRDLLPLVEGSTVSTKYGSVKTDHILFIASGAFHLAKPSDLIPEMQGRSEEGGKVVNEDEGREAGIEAGEQHSIVFSDEIDKVAKRSEGMGADVSREGVQRDLLPLVEGSTVSTKYGSVKTDHILFIASGAFHLAKPSDLIPEMQGRFPIRVELSALSKDDFVRILTEPKASLTRQYVELMNTEGVSLSFAPDAVDRLAEIAAQVNERQENIGARRLHTVLERLLDTLSFEAPDKSGTVAIDRAYVDKHLGELVQDQDLSRYIL